MQSEPTSWLLLIHQVPNSPPYLRVKMWRRLQKIGAVPVKNAVYVLPRSEQTLEDFHWIAREILEAGGDASVCEATFIEGITNSEVAALFQTAREPITPRLWRRSKNWDWKSRRRRKKLASGLPGWSAAYRASGSG